VTRIVDVDFRSERVGGDVVDPTIREAGTVVGLEALVGQPRLVVLVHGFNVDREEAKASYDKLLARLAGAVQSGQDWAFGAPVLRVFWPGDADWGWFSALVYPQAIGKASDCGRRLAVLLGALGQTVQPELAVDWLCHSMGNRVALQATAELAGNRRVRARRCLCLAAAVSTWQLERKGQDMRDGLFSALAGSGVTSVHSASDMVLAMAFPLGETLKASTQGFMPVAMSTGLVAAVCVDSRNCRATTSGTVITGRSSIWSRSMPGWTSWSAWAVRPSSVPRPWATCQMRWQVLCANCPCGRWAWRCSSRWRPPRRLRGNHSGPRRARP
jgi:hypothetical protein